jgi:hypothetical protein
MLINKKSTLTLLVFQLWATTPLFAGNYSLDDIDQEKYQTSYNKLPSVEDSNSLLKERNAQFSQLLKDAEGIVVKYGMETHIGLRLIHSHFPAEKNHVMVEEYQTWEGKPSLVTYAQNLEEAKEKKALPASWIFSGNTQDDVQIFETSTDPAVHAGVRMLQEKPSFMDEMGDLLRTTQFNSLLSVALMKRDSFDLKEEELYLENNSSTLLKSIVQAWNPKENPISAFQTSWNFKGLKGGCLKLHYCADWIPGHPKIEYHQHM